SGASPRRRAVLGLPHWCDQRKALNEEPMERRAFLIGLAAAPLAFSGRARAAPPATMKDIEELQKSWRSFLPAGASIPSPDEPLKLSEDEWKKRLPADSYRVLRKEGTEPAGTSPLNGEK